jgi:hypothetical protein
VIRRKEGQEESCRDEVQRCRSLQVRGKKLSSQPEALKKYTEAKPRRRQRNS